MKYFLLILFVGLFVIPYSFSQKVDCTLVDRILQEDIVQKYLSLTRMEPDVIIIVDTVGYFKDCSPMFFRNSRVVISDSYKEIKGNRIFYKNDKAIKASHTLVDIFRVEKKSKKVKIYIGQIETGKYGYLIFKKKRKRYKLCEHRLGQT